MGGERARGWKKWVRRVFWGVVMTSAALVAARVVAGVWASRAFEARLESLRASGAPMTLAEMAPPPVPPKENAAAVYAVAFARLDGLTREELDRVAALGLSGTPLSTEELIEAHQLLARTGDALTLLTAGAALPRCRYDVDYSVNAFRLRLPHVSKVRTGVAILRLAATVDLAEGRADDALAHAATAVRLAHSLRDEPTLIALLTELTSTASALREVEIVLDRSEPSAAALADAAAALSAPTDRSRLATAIRAERCAGIEAVTLARNDPNVLAEFVFRQRLGRMARARIRVVALIVEPLIVADAAHYVDIMGHLESLAASSHRVAGTEWGALNVESERTAFRWVAIHPVCRVLLPALNRASVVLDHGIARADEARVAVALRRCQLARGAYPDSLDALVPEFLDALPHDPFSSHASGFVYRRDADGFLLYSVGANARDESGAGGDSVSDADDVSWRCRR